MGTSMHIPIATLGYCPQGTGPKHPTTIQAPDYYTSIRVLYKHPTTILVYIYYILDSHMAPYGACEVVQSIVRSSEAVSN